MSESHINSCDRPKRYIPHTSSPILKSTSSAHLGGVLACDGDGGFHGGGIPGHLWGRDWRRHIYIHINVGYFCGAERQRVCSWIRAEFACGHRKCNVTGHMALAASEWQSNVITVPNTPAAWTRQSFWFSQGYPLFCSYSDQLRVENPNVLIKTWLQDTKNIREASNCAIFFRQWFWKTVFISGLNEWAITLGFRTAQRTLPTCRIPVRCLLGDERAEVNRSA